ncbi:MAG: hypothetical protein ABJA02_07545 [Acidobacteriota bacterium]
MQKRDLKKNWSITSTAFQGLLEWLDEGNDSGGQKYLEIRRRLVGYFDRRNCLTPDEMADETLNRIARRLEEQGKIESETPAKYCYITARFILLEYFRGKDRAEVSLESVQTKADLTSGSNNIEENAIREKMLDCLEHCTNQLEEVSRNIITKYYYGTASLKIKNRNALAQQMGISTNALSIRACRIRCKLEICVGKCVGSN